jgi:hypothetical protein
LRQRSLSDVSSLCLSSAATTNLAADGLRDDDADVAAVDAGAAA